MPNDSNRPDVAVFIDFENVYVSVRDKLDANPNFEAIMDRCEDFGRVVLARAYADWYRYPRVTSALYANTIEPMYVPTYHYDRDLGRTGRPIKNSVDMNLCVDAMKTLYTNPNIAKFVLATGDRDFIPLVNTIRQQGKEVIIIGIGGAASAHLAQSADEFIFYEQLIGKKPTSLNQDQPRAKMPEKNRSQYDGEDEAETPAPRERERDRDRDRDREVPTPAPVAAQHVTPAPVVPQPEREQSSAPDIYDTLVRAINLARERGYVCSFGSLKLLMKELMGGEFKEGKYKDAGGKPFAKFKDFVLEAERRGKVQVFTNGTVNEVFLPGEDPYKMSQFAAELKEEPAPAAVAIEQSSANNGNGRAESRLGISNNRRRRRRPRGGQRQGAQQNDDALLGDEFGDDFEDANTEATAEAPVVGSDESLIESFSGDEQSDAMFDSLLEQIEQEDQHAAGLDLPVLQFVDVPEDDDEDTEQDVEQPSAPVELPAAPVDSVMRSDRPFEDSEWTSLRDIVIRFGRPVSFVQIHDALRDARKRATIERTNEELRTLIKNAINGGMLERIGKGNRIVYRLVEPVETLETEAAASEAAVIDETPSDQMSQIVETQAESLTPDQAELLGAQFELLEDQPSDDQIVSGEAGSEGTSTAEGPGEADWQALVAEAQAAPLGPELDEPAGFSAPETSDDGANTQTEMFEAATAADDAESVTDELHLSAEAQAVPLGPDVDEPAGFSAPVAKDAELITEVDAAKAEPDNVAPEAKPKRQRRRKAAGEPVAEAAPAAQSAADEAKPKRRSKAAVPALEAAPAPEAKPKRRRAPRKTNDATDETAS